MTPPRNVAIFIFEEVEVLDFAGPFEVFNVTAELNDPTPFNVYTVAETAAPVKTRGKLRLHPNYSLYAMPKADILIIPGGAGTRPLRHRPAIIEWIQAQSQEVDKLMSVCTGSLLLAQAGLLDGKPSTTHHTAFDRLAQAAPATIIRTDKRYVDNGNILTSGGISAGIDLSLYMVQQLLGDQVLQKTLTEMEYHWSPDDSIQWGDAINNSD